MVCQNQSIDDSDAPLARDLRILVRERLHAGDSDTAGAGFPGGALRRVRAAAPRVLAADRACCCSGPRAFPMLIAGLASRCAPLDSGFRPHGAASSRGSAGGATARPSR